MPAHRRAQSGVAKAERNCKAVGEPAESYANLKSAGMSAGEKLDVAEYREKSDTVETMTTLEPDDNDDDDDDEEEEEEIDKDEEKATKKNGHASVVPHSKKHEPRQEDEAEEPPNFAPALARAVAEVSGLTMPSLFEIHSRRRARSTVDLDLFAQMDPTPLRVPGLYNLGNSCFINALLQAMASCPAVIDYARDISQECAAVGDESARAAMVAHLAGVLGDLAPKRSKTVLSTLNIRDLRRRLLLLSPAFRYSEQQQDADELLHLVLEAVDTAHLTSREYKRRHRPGLGGVAHPERDGAAPPLLSTSNPLQGSFMNQMMCATCGSISPLRASTMHVVPLPLVETGSGAVFRSLEAALRAFVSQETVEGVECFGLCHKQRRNMFRRSTLGRMPPVLCLHLGRRHFSMAMGRIIKLPHHVSFPTSYSFSSFAFHCNELQRGLMSNFAALAAPSAQGSSPRVTSPNWFRHGPSHMYDLAAVIVHHGSAHGGHFTAFRRLAGGVWVHVSDARVDRVSLETVLRAQAYMLFYTRRDICVPGQSAGAGPAACALGQGEVKKKSTQE